MRGVLSLIFWTLSLLLNYFGQGGWFPFVFGLAIFFLMQTWYPGRSAVTRAALSTEEGLDTFLKRVRSSDIARVPGTAIFMSGNMTGVPRSLVLSVRYNRVLHSNTILATVGTAQNPRVFDSTRVTVKALAPGLVRLIIRIGYMEGLNMPLMLAEARRCGIEYNAASAIYVMSRDDLVVSRRLRGMAVWRRWIFILMTKVPPPAAAPPPAALSPTLPVAAVFGYDAAWQKNANRWTMCSTRSSGCAASRKNTRPSTISSTPC